MAAAPVVVADVLLTYYFVLVFLASGLIKVLRPGVRPLGGRRMARLAGGAEVGLGLVLTQLWIAHAAVVGFVLLALILFLPIRVLSHRRNQGCGCFGQLTPQVRQASSALTSLVWIALAAVLFAVARSGPSLSAIPLYALSALAGAGYLATTAVVLWRHRHFFRSGPDAALPTGAVAASNPS